jgi:RND family efflux transporter MFP subunit
MMRKAIPISVLVLMSFAFGCHRSERATNAKAPTPVLVREVTEPPETRGARYSGTIEPATRVDVGFKVGGYVRELLQVKGEGGKLRKVQEGDFVTAGTALAVVREGDYLEKVAAANAQLAQALANQTQAQLDADRSAKLLASNAVPVAETDTMASRLAASKALVQGAEARTRDAQLLLADTTLRAPIDGVVLKRVVEVGTFVSPGAPGFSVADTSQVKFVFGAPDMLLERLVQGTKLAVHVDALGADVEGTITRIAPSADSKSHAFEIEATIANADGRLKTGFIASTAVPSSSQAGPIIALPLTGVVRSPKDPRGFAVYVVSGEGSDAVAHLRDVTLGTVIGNDVQVLSGLRKGDRIVSMGATLLVDGSRVRILPS